MPEEDASKVEKISRSKVYASAFGMFLLGNFAFETGITLLENATQQWLYPIFPFTRVGLLVITILSANFYIRRRSGKAAHKLWWRILKPLLLVIAAYGLFMGAWLNVISADEERARAELEYSDFSLPPLPEKTSN